MRAPASGNSIDEESAAVVKGMLQRGDRQHDIAAWFGVNGGRIGEISSGESHPEILPETENLPPQGPYNTAQVVFEARQQLVNIKEELDALSLLLGEQIDRLSTG